MYTLGINAVFHDTSAAIVKNGVVIAAAEEERFTHIKHGKRPIPFSAYELPFHSIDYCLREADVSISDIDHIAYSFDPKILMGASSSSAFIALPLEPERAEIREPFMSPWDPLQLCYILNAPKHLRSGVPHHLFSERMSFENSHYQWHFVNHHISHAASAYLPSPYADAAIMVIDGRGELASTSYYHGQQQQIECLGEVLLPNSLGLLYEKITSFLGFLHSSDEYKVMALASYGNPLFKSLFEELIELADNGQYKIKQIDLPEFLGPPRERGGGYSQRHFDIAHSLQVVLEDKVVDLANWLQRVSAENNLCLAGGVALNCAMNSRIKERSKFRNIWIQPAAGDAGTALGAAMFIDSRQRKSPHKLWQMEHVYLGPSYSDQEIEDFLIWSKTPYRKMIDVASETARILASDRIIGWFQGRMEFGPRSLGARSILASPLSSDMQARLNEIKDREDFRPVAPVVMAEYAQEWFVGAENSPFMLFVFDVLKDKEGKIPAVRHVDGTARVQTVSRNSNPLFYELLREFKALTAVPVLVNTSFNTRGEPIVCTPRDALESFWTSPLDALVIGSFLIEKKTHDHKNISNSSDL